LKALFKHFELRLKMSRPEIGLHIKWNKMNRRELIKEAVVAEYSTGKVSYRELSEKYDYSVGTVHRWVKEAGQKKSIKREGLTGEASLDKEEDLEAEVKRLRKKLKVTELHNEYLNELVDIAGRELGVDIRKKGGSRRR